MGYQDGLATKSYKNKSMKTKREFFKMISKMVADAPEHFNCIIISLSDYIHYELEPNDLFKYINEGYMIMYAHSKPQEVLLTSMSIYKK
jgi:hypothetical protein